jgi:hypothetical protein
MKVTITLNGTTVNPYQIYGLPHNPFPAIPIYGPTWVANANRIINSLESEPIKDQADLLQRLEGCSSEFIEICTQRYKPGELVSFDITFRE